MGLLIHQNHPKQIPKVTNPFGKYPNNKEEKNLNILIFSLYFNPRLGTKKADTSHAKTQFLPKWHVGIFRNFMGGFQCPKSHPKILSKRTNPDGNIWLQIQKKILKKIFLVQNFNWFSKEFLWMLFLASPSIQQMTFLQNWCVGSLFNFTWGFWYTKIIQNKSQKSLIPLGNTPTTKKKKIWTF